MITFLENTLQAYANQLTGLKRADGKRNFFVVPDPENAETALNALRNELGWPILLLEFPDNDIDEGSVTTDTLQVGLSVMKYVDTKTKGIDEIRSHIYETCVPLLEQIIARLKKDAWSKTLKYNCAPVQISTRLQGQWIGPVLNYAWGYRYSVEIKIYRDPFRVNASMWS